jgi:hypothetical protein
MQTRNKYEEMVLKELRDIPGRSQPQVLKILRSLRASIFASMTTREDTTKETGLCGIWKDKRDAKEIIDDIEKNRTGFGGREVEI